jgi:hypothetical protein
MITIFQVLGASDELKENTRVSIFGSDVFCDDEMAAIFYDALNVDTISDCVFWQNLDLKNISKALKNKLGLMFNEHEISLSVKPSSSRNVNNLRYYHTYFHYLKKEIYFDLFNKMHKKIEKYDSMWHFIEDASINGLIGFIYKENIEIYSKVRSILARQKYQISKLSLDDLDYLIENGFIDQETKLATHKYKAYFYFLFK